MTYLIDTDVMVDFFKHRDPAKGLIEKLSQNSTLALSTLTITELRSGWTSKEADYLLPRLYALCRGSTNVAARKCQINYRYLPKGTATKILNSLLTRVA